MILRPATAADVEALADVHAACFEAAWSPAALADLLAAPGAIALLVEDSDPVAFVLLRAVADEAEVLTIATLPEFRGRGAAAALMSAALGLAQGAGARMVFLEVATDNAAAQALYAGQGFEAAGVRRGYYKRGDETVDAQIMRRNVHNGDG